MQIEVSKDEYNAAIGRALEIVASPPQSAGSEALSFLLANMWDNTGLNGNVFECLNVMDAPTQQLGLCLVIGRTYYGRPVGHPRLDELRSLHFNRVFQRMSSHLGEE